MNNIPTRIRLVEHTFVVCLALGVVVLAHFAAWRIGTAGATRLLATFGATDWAVWVAGAGEVAKAGLPICAARLTATGTIRGLFIGTAFGLAWLIVAGLSALATHATTRDLFNARERLGQHAAETRNGLHTDMADAERWMTTTARDNPRPVDAVLGAQRAALARVPAWIANATEGCKSGVDADQRYVRPCAPARDLERELGAARGYEAARARVTELREKLAATDIVETSDPLAATAEAWGQHLGLSGASTIAILVVVACELLSCFGMAGVAFLWAIFPKSPQSAPRGRDDGTARKQDVYATVTNSPAAPAARDISYHPQGAAGTSRSGGIGSSHNPRSAGAQASHGTAAGASRSGRIGSSHKPRPVQVSATHATATNPPANAPRDSCQTVPFARIENTKQMDASAVAVRAFCVMLEPQREGRTPASQFYRTYMDLREIYGWPLLSQAKFGRTIVPLLASLGARRVKASSIVYVGICIPAALRAEAAQLGLVHLQQSRDGALSNRGDESAQQRSRMT